VKGGMHKVSVGPKENVMVVVFVGKIIPWTSVVNLTRLLAFPNSWLIHNYMLEIT
jgi:hypothetical protein